MCVATDTNLVWRYEKFAPFCASPLVYRDRVFIVKDGGILTCIEAATGKAFKSGRVMGTTNYYASPVAGDGKIFFTSEEGIVHVVKAGPEFAVLASNRIGAPCLATPAVADGMIFFRTETYLLATGRP